MLGRIACRTAKSRAVLRQESVFTHRGRMAKKAKIHPEELEYEMEIKGLKERGDLYFDPTSERFCFESSDEPGEFQRVSPNEGLRLVLATYEHATDWNGTPIDLFRAVLAKLNAPC